MSRVLGVLLTHRRPAAFAKALDALAQANPRPDRLIVVDNAPSAATRATAGVHAWIEYVPSESNLGPAGGRALGMQMLIADATDEDWIAFLDDDDPLPDPTVLGAVRAFADRTVAADPTTAGVALRGGRFDARRGYPVPVRVDGRTGGVAVDYLHGGFFPLYRVASVRDVGVFARELFFGWADLEYGLRLRRAGRSLYVSADLARTFVPQMGHPAEITRPRVALGPADARRYYTMRNWYHVLARNGHRRTMLRVFALAGVAKPLANLPRDPALAVRHLGLNLRAAFDAARGRLGPAGPPWDGAPPSEVEQ